MSKGTASQKSTYSTFIQYKGRATAILFYQRENYEVNYGSKFWSGGQGQVMGDYVQVADGHLDPQASKSHGLSEIQFPSLCNC